MPHHWIFLNIGIFGELHLFLLFFNLLSFFHYLLKFFWLLLLLGGHLCVLVLCIKILIACISHFSIHSFFLFSSNSFPIMIDDSFVKAFPLQLFIPIEEGDDLLVKILIFSIVLFKQSFQFGNMKSLTLRVSNRPRIVCMPPITAHNKI